MSTSPAPQFDAQAELSRAFAHAGERRDREDLTVKEARLRELRPEMAYASATERVAGREYTGEVIPPGATSGERVVNSEGYALARARGRSPEMGLRLLSQGEFVSELRLRTNVDTTTGAGLLVESARDVATAAHPVRLPNLIEIVPTDGGRVHRTSTTTYTGVGSETATGSALPALTALQLPAGQNEDIVLQPFGFTATVGLGHFLDRGPFQSTVNQLLRVELLRSLESSMLNSAGTGVLFQGVLSTSAGIPVIDATSQDNELAVGKGVETVQAAGFGFAAPLVALAHPTTLRKLRFSQRTSTTAYITVPELLPDISRWLPCLSIPVGTVLVGEAFSGCVLWVGPGGVQFEASRSDSTNWVDGNVTLRFVADLAFRTRQSSAWCAVTNLA